MSGTFWGDLVANVVGGLVAGLVIVWVAEKTFGLRKERDRRRAERKREVERARAYLDLLRDEVRFLAKILPGQVEDLMSKEWGMAVDIVTPVWDVVEQSGELVPLVSAEVLQETVFFYAALRGARSRVDFLMQTWLVPEESVEEIKGKRVETRDSTADVLKVAMEIAEGLLEKLQEEIARLDEEIAKLKG